MLLRAGCRQRSAAGSTSAERLVLPWPRRAFDMTSVLRAALLSALLPSLAVGTWRDPPLAASSILSLDGDVERTGEEGAAQVHGWGDCWSRRWLLQYESGVDFTADPSNTTTATG